MLSGNSRLLLSFFSLHRKKREKSKERTKLASAHASNKNTSSQIPFFAEKENPIMNSESEKRALQKNERNTITERSIKSAENTQNPIKFKTPIILFTGKKKRFRFSFRKCIVPFLSVVFAFCLLFGYMEKKISPQIPTLAEIGAKNHLYETVNMAIEELSEDGLLEYNSMVKTRRDEMGQVIYLEVDTSLLNKVKSMLIRRIDEKLEQNKKIKISVPIGSITDSNLLSGTGFPVSVYVYPTSVTEGDIHTVLEDCGINQTRHLIQIKIKAELLIVFSGETKIAETEITLPLGERVLVGDVPEIYLDNIGAN